MCVCVCVCVRVRVRVRVISKSLQSILSPDLNLGRDLDLLALKPQVTPQGRRKVLSAVLKGLRRFGG